MAGGIFFLWTARPARHISNQPANLFFLSEGKFFPSPLHRNPLSNSSPRGAFICFLVCFLSFIFLICFLFISIYFLFFFGLFLDYFSVFHIYIIIINNNINMTPKPSIIFSFFDFSHELFFQGSRGILFCSLPTFLR